MSDRETFARHSDVWFSDHKEQNREMGELHLHDKQWCGRLPPGLRGPGRLAPGLKGYHEQWCTINGKRVKVKNATLHNITLIDKLDRNIHHWHPDPNNRTPAQTLIMDSGDGTPFLLRDVSVQVATPYPETDIMYLVPKQMFDENPERKDFMSFNDDLVKHQNNRELDFHIYHLYARS